MKKYMVMVLFCMTMICTGCSESKQDVGKQEKSREKIVNEEQTDIEIDTTDENSSEKSGNVVTEKNQYSVYIDAEEVAEMEMGVNENGQQKVLCTIKLPMNYFTAASYMTETGEETSMQEINGNLLMDILDLGTYEKSGKISSTIVLTASGEVDNSYTITIVDAERISVESEKDYAPDGIEISSGEGHDAYAYARTGQFDLVLAYQLNENWTLLVENSGEVKDHISLEEFGKEIYQLITPIQ